MKRILAFLTALALFLLTAAGLRFAAFSLVPEDDPSFCVWPLEEKENHITGLTQNMLSESIPVFGSSEFQHGLDTPYHPATLFAGSDFAPLLLGAGYYQSLYHAITLAAIEPSLPQPEGRTRKAVLILSPQWFRKTGVVDQAFSSRFSELMYQNMLCNEQLSEETKSYLSARTHALLGSVDKKTEKHVQLHEKVLWKQEADFSEILYEKIWNLFLTEKDRFQLAANVAAAKLNHSWPETKFPAQRQAAGNDSTEDSTVQLQAAGDAEAACTVNAQAPVWDALLARAEADGIRENQNELYISQKSYRKLLPHLPSKKDMNKDAKKGYQKSPEYDDLRCFLKVCQELDIQPMLVILPVNGYYYDYTGFPSSARQAYYENIRALASEYHAKTADFSGQEYTKYFFEDRVHIGKTGWVKINESIYDFYKMEGV